MSLVDTWLEAVHKQGVNTAQAVRDMNAELGTAYSASRVGEWRTGPRTPHHVARRYMLRIALAYLYPKMRKDARERLMENLL